MAQNQDFVWSQIMMYLNDSFLTNSISKPIRQWQDPFIIIKMARQYQYLSKRNSWILPKEFRRLDKSQIKHYNKMIYNLMDENMKRYMERYNQHRHKCFYHFLVFDLYRSLGKIYQFKEIYQIRLMQLHQSYKQDVTTINHIKKSDASISLSLQRRKLLQKYIRTENPTCQAGYQFINENRVFNALKPLNFKTETILQHQ